MSSRAAPSATRRSNRRRRARSLRPKIGAAAETASSSSSAASAPAFPLARSLGATSASRAGAARQVVNEVERGERRSGVGERHGPSSSRPRRGASAGPRWDRRRGVRRRGGEAGTGQFRLLASAASAPKGRAARRRRARHHRLGGGRRRDRGRPAPHAGSFRAAASCPALSRVERRCRSAATAARRSGRNGPPVRKGAEGGVDLSRRP